MPRPGPRPYECVRRAWHSERHQPMRGSIIQQIFRFWVLSILIALSDSRRCVYNFNRVPTICLVRVVNESHSAATKRNKEWQEKLPIVVLKAEEIMYSKANSEAEYMNPETLWDRVNDAVNTIIRRDENSETGELLPPCIEAALNLGCITVRASRSQRHSNPRSYLTPRAQEPASSPARVFDKTTYEQRPLLPFHSGNQLNLARATAMNPARLVSESNIHVNPSSKLAVPHNYPLLIENTAAGRNQFLAMESDSLLNFGTVYPVYYGTHSQTGESQLGSWMPKEPHSETIFVGKPIMAAAGEPAKNSVLQNPFSCQNAENASNRFLQMDVLDTQEKPQEKECDLSLRLGQFSHSCMSIGSSSVCETEDVHSTSSQEGGRFSDLSPQTIKEFSFFPRKAGYESGDSRSRKWNMGEEGQGQRLETTRRKRKAPFCNGEDG